MTVIVSKPAVNLREELASLRNQGGYQEQQFYFDGLVTNGTFDTDASGWTPVAVTTSVSSGVVTVTNNGGSNGTLTQTVSTVVGRTYVIQGVGTAGTGGARIYVVGLTGYFISGEATFVATTTSTTISLLVFGSDGTSASFDNISVFEIDANDDVVHRMPKGWVPKDVYEDGLLQREGSAHDYEVVYDGFDYYVKPTVAPTATTQTCVIGVKA